MNKSKIEWVQGSDGKSGYTWNPVTGCLHNCEYCYARRIANRFKGWTDSEGDTHYDTILTTDNLIRELQEPLYIAPKERLGKWPKAPYPYGFIPTFHRYRLDEPARKTRPRKIFVCSMADLFGEWVPDEWQLEVYKACGKADWHKYLFLTKNPKAYSKVFYRSELDYRHNFWLGTTVTDDKSFNEKGFELFEFTGADQKRHANRFLSIEPLLGEISDKVLRNVQFIDWVIIGAETGNRKGKVIPKREWVESIVFECHKAGVPVFMKNSLKDLMGDDFIQEWPEGLR